GGEHGVPHPRLPGRPRDGARVEPVRVEEVRVPLVLLDPDTFVAHHPLVPGERGVQPDVHEQAEPRLPQPRGPILWIRHQNRLVFATRRASQLASSSMMTAMTDLKRPMAAA